MVMWIYRLAIYSRSREHVWQAQKACSEREYEISDLRHLIEQQVEAMIRSTEGIYPDTPIEVLGWRRMEFNDDGTLTE